MVFMRFGVGVGGTGVTDGSMVCVEANLITGLGVKLLKFSLVLFWGEQETNKNIKRK
jgi:hypothetical protein